LRSSRPAVRASGVSSWASRGAARNAKPVAVISRPLWLSGRRRHATSPHAANDPPTIRKTTVTSTNVTAGPRVSRGTSTPRTAAASAVQPATQNAS